MSDPFLRYAEPSEQIVKATFVYRNIGMGIEHNYLCSVCREKPAVLQCWIGVLQPCWDCQKNGWATVKMPKILQWIRDR